VFKVQEGIINTSSLFLFKGWGGALFFVEKIRILLLDICVLLLYKRFFGCSYHLNYLKFFFSAGVTLLF